MLGFGKGSAFAEETILCVSVLVTDSLGESSVVEEVWTTVCVEGKRKACDPLMKSLMVQVRGW